MIFADAFAELGGFGAPPSGGAFPGGTHAEGPPVMATTAAIAIMCLSFTGAGVPQTRLRTCSVAAHSPREACKEGGNASDPLPNPTAQSAAVFVVGARRRGAHRPGLRGPRTA